MRELGKYSINDLKEMCKKNDLVRSGGKPELLLRFVGYNK
jgi:hypothetical protein